MSRDTAAGGAVASGGKSWDGGAAAAGGADNFNEGSVQPSYDQPLSNDYGGGGQGGYGDGGDGGDRPRGCFNCCEEGHSKADCSNPAKPRACFKCGEEGHTKAECTNESVAREFTGVCRVCDQQGHRAADCPSKPPAVCRNCEEEGHEAVKCENPRKIHRERIEDVPGEVAWEQLRAAVADHDLDDVKAAAEKYIKANPDATYLRLEKAFRSQNLGIYLIAIEKELATTYSNMDLQGNLDKKYTIQWRWSPQSARPKEAEGWPTPEENLERLADAGEPVDRGIPKCSNCDELGHTRNKCEQEKNLTDRAEVKCYNCDGVGHRVRDCPNPRPDKFACRNCHQSGHSSKECPEPRSAEGVECKKCGEVGHFSRDCPQGGGGGACHNCGEEGHRKQDCRNERVMKCRNCDAFGHMSKECPEPKDWSRVKCSICEEMGHTKVRCPRAKAEAEAAENGDGGYGGGAVDHADTGGYGGGDDFVAAPIAGGGESWDSAPVTSAW